MINVAAKGFKLTDGIKDKVLDNLKKLNKFELENKEVNVSLSTETYGQKAEINLKIDKANFRAESINSDLYAAIASAVNTLIKQVRRYRDYEKDNQRDSIRFEAPLSATQTSDSNEPKIVKRKMITAKPMFEKEAILQMELLDHRSFMFHNEDTNSPCMIYKRHDGNYGIIETV